jgi:DNA mismatch repair protein MutL
VRSKTATAALEQAFTSYMAPEKFPVCCLFITVECDKVDVNVHPTKMEVRFSDERSVFESVYYGVRSALEKGELRPDLYRENTRDLKGKQLLGAFTPLGGQPKSEQLTISTITIKNKPLTTFKS